MSAGSHRLGEALRCSIDHVTIDDDRAGQLADMVDDACDRQRQQLKAAIDDGLDNIPRPLRGTVKKMLFR